MALTIELPEQYGYVGLALASYFWLTEWQMMHVSKYRKLAKIPYPFAYADRAQQEASKDALKFNCAQRSHMNTLESLPVEIAMTLFIGLKYPVLAASTGLGWSFGRILYTLGYTTGDPKARNTRGGFLAPVIFLAQGLATTWCATAMIMGW